MNEFSNFNTPSQEYQQTLARMESLAESMQNDKII